MKLIIHVVQLIDGRYLGSPDPTSNPEKAGTFPSAEEACRAAVRIGATSVRLCRVFGQLIAVGAAGIYEQLPEPKFADNGTDGGVK